MICWQAREVHDSEVQFQEDAHRLCYEHLLAFTLLE